MKTIGFTVAALVAAWCLSPDAAAGGRQNSARRKFEVVSVKPNLSGERSSRTNVQPGGRYLATNVTVRSLIMGAYHLQIHQLAGDPDWIGTERFDIQALAEGGDIAPGTPWEFGPFEEMLQSLLADRFGLVAHTEARPMAIYALVMARSDRRPGPSLTPSTVDCIAVRAAAMRGVPEPPPADGRPRCGMRRLAGSIAAGGIPLSFLANSLTDLGRPVVDRTGLDGVFDFTLTWREQSVSPTSATTLEDGPSVFTALQEQLGLKLEAQRAPVDVLVIDRVERPKPE